MTNNLELWDAVADIDPKFTKAITGKPYKGTSPNPHYLIKLATEHLGPVGTAWGFNVVSEGFQPLGNETHHWCRLRVWTNSDDRTGYEAYGQTKAAYETKPDRDGHVRTIVDEDAAKKSLTDALTKALAQLGFAANIFLGRWDDSKHVAEVNEKFRQEERAESEADHAKRLSEECVSLEAVTTLEELKTVWTRIYKAWGENTPAELIRTKDTMKARLEDEAKGEAA